MKSKLPKLLLLAYFSITFMLAPAHAQFGMADPDPAVSTTLDWARTRPVYPIIPPEVTGCMSTPSLPFQKLSGKTALTPEQEQSLYTFEGQFMKLVEPKITNLHSLQRQQQDLMTAAQVDPAKVKDLQNQINNVRNEITGLCLDQQLKALDILTPEQRREIQSLMIKEHNRHHWL